MSRTEPLHDCRTNGAGKMLELGIGRRQRRHERDDIAQRPQKDASIA
jgi:hypothetical protein